VQVYRIYATRENREWLQEHGIRITAPPLGSTLAKEKQTLYCMNKKRKEAAERNQIEGKFGQGKNGYNLNKIRVKLQKISAKSFDFLEYNMIHRNLINRSDQMKFCLME
jgi:IS5 family transposase